MVQEVDEDFFVIKLVKKKRYNCLIKFAMWMDMLILVVLMGYMTQIQHDGWVDWLASEAEGRGFESHLAHQLNSACYDGF